MRALALSLLAGLLASAARADDTPTPFPISPTATYTQTGTPTGTPTSTPTFTPPICSQYQDLVIEDNPRVFYRMNDASGTQAIHDTMNRNDGIAPP